MLTYRFLVNSGYHRFLFNSEYRKPLNTSITNSCDSGNIQHFGFKIFTPTFGCYMFTVLIIWQIHNKYGYIFFPYLYTKVYNRLGSMYRKKMDYTGKLFSNFPRCMYGLEENSHPDTPMYKWSPPPPFYKLFAFHKIFWETDTLLEQKVINFEFLTNI